MWTMLGQLYYGRGLGRGFSTAWLAFFFAVAPLNAYAASLDFSQAFRLSQSAVGRTVSDEVFRDSNGKSVRLSDFRGKPLVISFIYSSCSSACSSVTKTINDVRHVTNKSLGDGGFSVISVGFDVANDSPEKMKQYAINNGVNGKANWRFLSADLATVKRLAGELGFVYRPSPGEGFKYLPQVTVLDAKGKVYRQVYGNTFELPLLVDPLNELILSTSTPFASLGDMVNRVRLFYTVYDPRTNSYHLNYPLLIRITISIIMIGLIGGYAIRGWLLLYRRQRIKG